MNRKEIKANAKEIIKGNKWNLWKPYLLLFLIMFAAGFLLALMGLNEDVINVMTSLLSLASIPYSFAIYAYVLKIIRKEPYDVKMLFSFYNIFIPLLVLTILISIFVTIGFLLFIIPGVIIALMLTFSQVLIVDGHTGPWNCIVKSKEMMQGYKWDYFKFLLSFIGWVLLCIPTFGLISIYVVPYFMTAQMLYYEELRKNS